MADEQPPKKKSKLKWFLLLLLLLLILGGGGAGAWFFFLAEKLHPAGSGGTPAPQKVETTSAQTAGRQVVPLPVFTTNLADPLGQRFIKLSIEVELAGPKVALELDQQKARVRDSVILLLSSKSYADIATMESKLMLKNEITDRLNNILGAGKVYQVFITDMVIQ